MIRILGIGLIAFLIFVLEKELYKRLWNRHLQVSVAFAGKSLVEGEKSELKEIIENRKRLPISMLKVKFQTDRHLVFEDAKGSRTTDRFYRNDVFHISGGERITRTLKFTAGRRGYYTIDNMDLVASDLFLTTQMVQNEVLKTQLYVYPKPFDSREFRLSLQQLNGEVLTKRHLLTDPFEYRGIREYQPFDDMRSINWKATAKTGELKVNQKNYTALKSIRIYFDIQDDNIIKKTECVEASLQIVAGLSRFFLSQGIQVACYGNGVDILSHKPVSTEARAGNEQLQHIYRLLARVDTDLPTADFARNFEESLFTEGKGTITCFVSPNHYEDFLTLVQKYQETGRDFWWFYPVSGSGEPELAEALQKHLRFLHI